MAKNYYDITLAPGRYLSVGTPGATTRSPGGIVMPMRYTSQLNSIIDMNPSSTLAVFWRNDQRSQPVRRAGNLARRAQCQQSPGLKRTRLTRYTLSLMVLERKTLLSERCARHSGQPESTACKRPARTLRITVRNADDRDGCYLYVM